MGMCVKKVSGMFPGGFSPRLADNLIRISTILDRQRHLADHSGTGKT